jgi:hypothetical protein
VHSVLAATGFSFRDVIGKKAKFNFPGGRGVIRFLRFVTEKRHRKKTSVKRIYAQMFQRKEVGTVYLAHRSLSGKRLTDLTRFKDLRPEEGWGDTQSKIRDM